jgi:uncharacterized protein
VATKIGLLSDTHSHLPEEVFIYFKEVDEIWHAGDIGNIELLEQLQSFKPTRAVFGNIDGTQVRKATQEHLIFTLEGAKIFITHIGGYPTKYNSISKPIILREAPHLFICGHSHILKVIKDDALKLLHLNPGACGKQGWHSIKTLMRFSLEDARVKSLEVIELGPK